MKNLHDWVINYNAYTKTWRATKREDYSLLFSDSSNSKVLKAASVEILIDIIARTNGDTTKLNYISEQY